LVVVLAVGVLVLRSQVVGALGVAALGAIAGGGASNLLDRIRLGSVTDFIEIHRWPTNFNLADAAIRIGLVLSIVALLLERRWRRCWKRCSSGRSTPRSRWRSTTLDAAAGHDICCMAPILPPARWRPHRWPSGARSGERSPSIARRPPSIRWTSSGSWPSW